MYQGLRLSRLWLVAVIVAFCLPLFTGLGKPDLETDEAIYSFAVDRILEIGDWLEPKSSPSETDVFLEKPPLKFWLVANGIAGTRSLSSPRLIRYVAPSAHSSPSSWFAVTDKDFSR